MLVRAYRPLCTNIRLESSSSVPRKGPSLGVLLGCSSVHTSIPEHLLKGVVHAYRRWMCSMAALLKQIGALTRLAAQDASISLPGSFVGFPRSLFDRRSKYNICL